MPKRFFYAVKIGRQSGVFTNWKDCDQMVKGFPNAKYEKFLTRIEAETYIGDDGDVAPDSEMSSTSTYVGNKRPLSPEIEDQSVVYTDGACKGNGRNGSVAGIGVWWGHDDPRNLAERCPGEQTNNRAELVAIVRALETTPTNTVPLVIKTDSEYCCNTFHSWLSNWERNGYKTAGGHPVKNIDIILYVQALLDARRETGQTVDLAHVRGHVGITGNEGADALATRGSTLPPEQDRDWKALVEEVRCKMATSSSDGISTRRKSSPTKARRISIDDDKSPPSSPSAGSRPIQLPFSPSTTKRDSPRRNFRSNAKLNQRMAQLHIVVDPEDIDLGLYIDCLLEEDELWKDLQD